MFQTPAYMFTTGPVPVYPEILRALAQPVSYDYTSEFQFFIKVLLKNWRM